MAYPTVQELKDFLVAGQLVTDPTTSPESLLDYANAIDEAIDAWETDTGYLPFVATGTPTTRVFDMPSSSTRDRTYIQFNSGAVSVSSVVVDGTTLTSGTDYFLLPRNASVQRQPYQSVLLYRRNVPYSTPQSVSITADWGYTSTLQEDAFTAVMKRAVLSLMPQILTLRSGGGIKRARLDGVIEEEYDLSASNAIAKLYEVQYRKTVNKYRYIGI